MAAHGRFIVRRDGFWHYARRVPASVAELDPRIIVKQSTKIRIADDPRGVKAQRVAERINEQTEAYWRGLGEGQAAETKARYDAARRQARRFGFEYDLARNVAQRPARELLARVQTVTEHEEAIAGVWGGEEPPAILLSKLFDEFEALTEALRVGMSPDQIRKAANPRKRAVENLIKVLGNKSLASLTRDDALEFQDWWTARIIEEELEIKSANRELGSISRMIKTVDRRHRLGVERIFADLRIAGEKAVSRIPYTAAFIQDELLRDGALDALNLDARCAIYAMVETGMRPSEAVNLNAETILLNDPVPHVRVRPDGRKLKAESSLREIPLVGVSLMAFQACPNGFGRYRDKAATLSATANKVMASNGLRPAEGQTIYSLRHSFEDRLGDVEAPEKMIATLMGHKHSRPKYGAGPTLAQKQKWLQTIAFRPPSRV